MENLSLNRPSLLGGGGKKKSEMGADGTRRLDRLFASFVASLRALQLPTPRATRVEEMDQTDTWVAFRDNPDSVAFAMEELFRAGKIATALDLFRAHVTYGEIDVRVIPNLLSSCLDDVILRLASPRNGEVGEEDEENVRAIELEMLIAWLRDDVLPEMPNDEVLRRACERLALELAQVPSTLEAALQCARLEVSPALTSAIEDTHHLLIHHDIFVPPPVATFLVEGRVEPPSDEEIARRMLDRIESHSRVVYHLDKHLRPFATAVRVRRNVGSAIGLDEILESYVALRISFSEDLDSQRLAVALVNAISSPTRAARALYLAVMRMPAPFHAEVQEAVEEAARKGNGEVDWASVKRNMQIKRVGLARGAGSLDPRCRAHLEALSHRLLSGAVATRDPEEESRRLEDAIIVHSALDEGIGGLMRDYLCYLATASEETNSGEVPVEIPTVARARVRIHRLCECLSQARGRRVGLETFLTHTQAALLFCKSVVTTASCDREARVAACVGVALCEALGASSSSGMALSKDGNELVEECERCFAERVPRVRGRVPRVEEGFSDGDDLNGGESVDIIAHLDIKDWNKSTATYAKLVRKALAEEKKHGDVEGHQDMLLEALRAFQLAHAVGNAIQELSAPDDEENESQDEALLPPGIRDSPDPVLRAAVVSSSHLLFKSGEELGEKAWAGLDSLRQNGALKTSLALRLALLPDSAPPLALWVALAERTLRTMLESSEIIHNECNFGKEAVRDAWYAELATITCAGYVAGCSGAGDARTAFGVFKQKITYGRPRGGLAKLDCLLGVFQTACELLSPVDPIWSEEGGAREIRNALQSARDESVRGELRALLTGRAEKEQLKNFNAELENVRRHARMERPEFAEALRQSVEESLHSNELGFKHLLMESFDFMCFDAASARTTRDVMVKTLDGFENRPIATTMLVVEALLALIVRTTKMADPLESTEKWEREGGLARILAQEEGAMTSFFAARRDPRAVLSARLVALRSSALVSCVDDEKTIFHLFTLLHLLRLETEADVDWLASELISTLTAGNRLSRDSSNTSHFKTIILPLLKRISDPEIREKALNQALAGTDEPRERVEMLRYATETFPESTVTYLASLRGEVVKMIFAAHNIPPLEQHEIDSPSHAHRLVAHFYRHFKLGTSSSSSELHATASRLVSGGEKEVAVALQRALVEWLQEDADDERNAPRGAASCLSPSPTESFEVEEEAKAAVIARALSHPKLVAGASAFLRRFLAQKLTKTREVSLARALRALRQIEPLSRKEEEALFQTGVMAELERAGVAVSRERLFGDLANAICAVRSLSSAEHEGRGLGAAAQLADRYGFLDSEGNNEEANALARALVRGRRARELLALLLGAPTPPHVLMRVIAEDVWDGLFSMVEEDVRLGKTNESDVTFVISSMCRLVERCPGIARVDVVEGIAKALTSSSSSLCSMEKKALAWRLRRAMNTLVG